MQSDLTARGWSLLESLLTAVTAILAPVQVQQQVAQQQPSDPLIACSTHKKNCLENITALKESWQSANQGSDGLQWHKQLALRLDDYESKFDLSIKEELESSEKGGKRIRGETF